MALHCSALHFSAAQYLASHEVHTYVHTYIHTCTHTHTHTDNGELPCIALAATGHVSLQIISSSTSSQETLGRHRRLAIDIDITCTGSCQASPSELDTKMVTEFAPVYLLLGNNFAAVIL